MGGNRLDRAAQQRLAEARAERKELWSWPIGNPEKLLDALARVFTPIRWSFWLLIPLVIMAFLISVKHSKEYFDEWTTVILSIPRLPASWAAEHVISWSARIVEGAVIHACGGKGHSCQLENISGVFLRLKLDEFLG